MPLWLLSRATAFTFWRLARRVIWSSRHTLPRSTRLSTPGSGTHSPGCTPGLLLRQVPSMCRAPSRWPPGGRWWTRWLRSLWSKGALARRWQRWRPVLELRRATITSLPLCSIRSRLMKPATPSWRGMSSCGTLPATPLVSTTLLRWPALQQQSDKSSPTRQMLGGASTLRVLACLDRIIRQGWRLQLSIRSSRRCFGWSAQPRMGGWFSTKLTQPTLAAYPSALTLALPACSRASSMPHATG
mmetsp:Transcript_32531/g.98055  ORF Transcript_32531/g.98055 Transcript_32531/m.98055 type:complete len:243 (+) Transcript_32531:1182-1910(+)